MILAIADRPGWAIDSKARNLRRILAGRFDLIVRYQHEVTEPELEAADLVMIFYWLEIPKMPLPAAALERSADRLVIGICSHRELEGDFRERGLATLNRLPRAVFANNLRLQREYAPLLDVPVHYTPNGVDTTFFRPSVEARKRVAGQLRVGWAGSLANHGAEHRRFDVIERAVASLSGVTLSTAIREQRWRNHDEMLEFYRDLDVYVCASRSEGTPNPCLEAAACGVPIITTAVGNMPELIEEGGNGYLFDGSVDGLAHDLAVLRDSPLLAMRMGARIRETITAWDWRMQAENYARMFDSVLKNRGQSALAQRQN
jgi:glycosyltransferase involved in cell wall biosynthesis